MKKLFTFLIILVVLSLSNFALADNPQIQAGLNWLINAKNGNEYWGLKIPAGTYIDELTDEDIVPTYFRDTCEAIDTLFILNKIGDDYHSAINWLYGNNPVTTENIARKVALLSRTSFLYDEDINLLLSYQNTDGGFGAYKKFKSNIVDSIYTLISLLVIDDIDSYVVESLLQYTLDIHNLDGGWGFKIGSDSNVLYTSLVLLEYSKLQFTYDLEAEINDSAAYLLSKQNIDGGFGTSDSTVYETALAYLALIKSGHGGALPLQNAINYLLANQQPNGSWDDDPYSTALALRALANVKPNLTLSPSDITFSNLVPTVGETITITADIRNTGPVQADTVLVRFYEGDPSSGGVLIGEDTVSILSFGSGQAHIDWTISSPASVAVFVEIDPLNSIEETNETDNIADTNFSAASGPNLVVTGIDFTPDMAVVGQPVDIAFVVSNLGETAVSGVFVEYYHAGGTKEAVMSGMISPDQYSKAGEATISALGPGDSYTISTQMSLDLGYHSIKVIADPLNAISETNEDDNEMKGWTASLPEQTDLIINRNIIVTPKDPKANDDIVIYSQAYNYGSITATSVNISVYDDDPDAGGIRIDEQTMDMAPLDYKNLEFHLSLAQGVHDIHIVVDPDNIVAEADETNNRAMKTVTVDMASYVDFAITSEDIAFAPAQFLPGDTITITASVHNLETQSDTTSVSFYEGNPSFGGTKIGEGTITITGGGTENAGISYTVPQKPAIIFVVLDEDDLVYEKRESNNKAFKGLSTGLPDLLVRDKDIKINRMSDGSIYISPLIRNLGGLDASTVPVSVYDGDPGSGGALIAEVTVEQVPAGLGKRINVPYTLSEGRHNIYVTADPYGQIEEIFEANNTGMKVVYKTDPDGPDITVTDIDSSGIATDTQELTVNGMLGVTIENTSTVDVTAAFTITAYEDKNKNAIFDSGVDNILGESIVSGGLVASAVNSYSIDISGQVRFRDNHIHVMADSTDAVTEYDEGNNDRHHKEDCKKTPEPVGNFEVVEKWVWMGSDNEPLSNMVRMAPLVANMNDDNGDGIIDEEDIPDIIIVTQEAMTTTEGILRVISGRDGEELWSATHPLWLLGSIVGLAAGDIDNDGAPEIIAPLLGYRQLAAYNHDGTLLWTSESVANPAIGGLATTIADLDNDGNPEIQRGTTLFNNKGEIIWRKTSTSYATPVPIAVDLDNDDDMELVRSSMALNYDGSIHWFQSMIATIGGYNAIGNFDNDIEPEVVHTIGRVDLLEHDKTIKWTFLDNTNYRYEMQSAPAVGDVDGDGIPEIVVSGHNKLTVFNSDGTLRWDAPVYDSTGGVITPVVFDLNGDNKMEIAVNDAVNFFVFNGDTGDVIFSTPNPAITVYEMPAVADIDNDGHVELILFSAMRTFSDPYYGGIRIFGEANDKWVSSRRIWNQHSYHVTNIDEDVYIPLREEDSWKGPNCYRCNIPLDDALDSPDLSVSKLHLSRNNYPDHVTLTVRAGNAGTLLVREGADVSFYNGDPSAGGVLLGSAATTRHLNPEEYEDISFSWYYPSAGTYEIYAVADGHEEIDECDEDNNTVSTTLTVGPIALPDLSILSTDISITPQPLIEGQPALISAEVHNIGDTGASNVAVSFYDGDPDSGGALIDSVIIDSVDAGLSNFAEASWDTMGQTGVNFIHVVVDHQNLIEEYNENNNSTLIQADVSPPVLPDLFIISDDITLSNQYPVEGDPLTLTATVRNYGTDEGNIEVHLYDGEPGSGGALLDTYTIAPVIPFGGQEEVVFNIITMGMSGSHSFYVTVDPDNTIAEQNEDNNITSADLIISSIGLDVTIMTDNTQYTADNDVNASVTITDLQNQARDILVDITILDSSGAVAGSVAYQSITLNPLETQTLGFIWNTGTTLAGEYTARATIYDTGLNPVAAGYVPISIVSSGDIGSSLVTDRIEYNPNETAVITSTIINSSSNSMYENITASVTIKDASEQILYTERRNIGLLATLSHYSFNTYWNTETYPAGTYPVTLEVRDSGDNVISVSTTNLTISSDINPSQLLSGEITVDTQSLLQGEPVNISYSVTNIGNIDLAQVDLSIMTVHVVELTAYDTLTDQTSLLMSETFSNVQQLDTQSYSAKDYLVILRAAVSGIETTLAGTYFRVEGAPSAPSLNWPIHEEDVETLIPGLIVNNASDPNNDELTYEFELYADSGLTTLLASESGVAEGENTTTWTVPLELVENETYVWRARAYDGLLYGDWMVPVAFRVNIANDPPAAPTLSSPADNSEVDTYTPVLAVNNAYDPDSDNLTYNFEVSLDIDFTQIVAGQTGVFEGYGTTSWQVPVNLTENTYYYWRSQADDWFIDGPWMTPAMFFVNTTNDAPSVPTISAPATGSEITALETDIVILNSTDPENDTLTYVFELDTVITFDSADLINSGNIPEGSGTTLWHVSGLSDNTHYYVRVKAGDGLAESAWSEVTGFFANTLNDPPTAPVLANPSDGSGVNVFTPELSVINSTDIDEDILTYEFEIYDDAELTNLVSQATGVEETDPITSWTVPMDLTENSTYYWRTRAFDGELYSSWMPSASFMVNTANDAPTVPALHSPAEGSSIDVLNPTLAVYNASDPDSDDLTYDIEIYSDNTLVQSITGIAENASGITSVTLTDALTDNTTYTWRARANDGDRYGAWMDMAAFSIHLPVVSINATINFDPNTLNKGSNGKWVVVYIELPDGYIVEDIVVSSVLLEGSVAAESWPYSIGDHDKDGIPDLMVKFRRSDVIDLLPNGENVMVHVNGEVGEIEFEGVDVIRVIP